MAPAVASHKVICESGGLDAIVELVNCGDEALMSLGLKIILIMSQQGGSPQVQSEGSAVLMWCTLYLTILFATPVLRDLAGLFS